MIPTWRRPAQKGRSRGSGASAPDGRGARHADQQVRGAVVLPHGTGRSIRVLVLAKGDKATEAETAGADFVGAEDMVQKIQTENWWGTHEINFPTQSWAATIDKVDEVKCFNSLALFLCFDLVDFFAAARATANVLENKAFVRIISWHLAPLETSGSPMSPTRFLQLYQEDGFTQRRHLKKLTMGRDVRKYFHK